MTEKGLRLGHFHLELLIALLLTQNESLSPQQSNYVKSLMHEISTEFQELAKILPRIHGSYGINLLLVSSYKKCLLALTRYNKEVRNADR